MIRKLILGIVLAPMLLLTPVLTGGAGLALHSPAVYADSVDDACGGIGLAGGSCTGDGGSTKISNVIKAIINILSAIVGVAAVIMIIIGGLRYVTSGGDSNGVSSAKNTIIYAIVGLVVVALAQVLVHFVIKTAS